MAVQEKKPIARKLVPKGYIPADSVPYKVRRRDTLQKIAKRVGIKWKELAEYNWKTYVRKEVNWYLANYVGCGEGTDDGKWYTFRGSPSPGIIYIPRWPSRPSRVSRLHSGNPSRATLLHTSPPILVNKIPLGRKRSFSKAKYTIGKIYVSTKWGGILTLNPSNGRVQLFYKNGKDIDDVTQAEIIKGQHSVKGPANLLKYKVPKDKHGWYFVRIEGARSTVISTKFRQKGKANYRPWNGWYCPTEPSTDPNLYEKTGNFIPLKKYDSKYGTHTRAWEKSHHVGRADWEGHCWGWSVASISKRGPITGSSGLTKWEMRALYTELGDNADIWGEWKIGSAVNEIPSGPVSEALNQPLDRWVKKFHDGIRKWIGDHKRPMNADLRSDNVEMEWIAALIGGSPASKIPGVRLLQADSKSGLSAYIYWNKASSALRFHNGSWVPVTSTGIYKLTSSIGDIKVRARINRLPATDAQGKIKLSTEVWNHALFKYIAKFKEAPTDHDERCVQITTTIYGNDDTPFPPGETSTVSRKYTYRLTYDAAGDTTKIKENWISCHGDLPPACIGIVRDEAAFHWKANCGITKARVEAL